MERIDSLRIMAEAAWKTAKTEKPLQRAEILHGIHYALESSDQDIANAALKTAEAIEASESNQLLIDELLQDL